MSTSDSAGDGGPLSSVCALQRSVCRDGIELQRDVADSLLDGVDRSEDHRRRARLSSHYAAVRAVDQLETAHPQDDPSMDPLYDGVARTFEVITDLDDHATETATSTVETAATLSEDLTRRVMLPAFGRT